MSLGNSQTQTALDDLKPGDRIEVEHTVIVGQTKWPSKTLGTVVRVERRRHGLSTARNFDDKVHSDTILLKLPDGELTNVTMDEFTVIRPA